MMFLHFMGLDLDRSLRSNFSYESMNFSSYAYDYKGFDDFCEITTGHEWASTLTLIAVVLGILTSIVYLVVAIRHFNALASYFLFLNNFLLASFINLMTGGLFDVMTFRSYCWYAGRLLCKGLPTIFDTSENAMIFFLVAIILEQYHPYVQSFLSKNTKVRKRTTTIVLWLVTVVFSIPEVIIWDLHRIFSTEPFCGVVVSKYHHYRMYLLKAILLEYILPLLLLIVTLAHAAAVSSRRSDRPTGDQAPGENYSRNGEDERQQETNNQCPPIRVTSVAIGVLFCVMKTPHYVSRTMFAFSLYVRFLYGLSFVLYPIPSIIAPVVVLFSSPIHKKRLKETYQSIASCISGRNVKREYLLSAEDDEEKPEETNMEKEAA